MPVPPQPRPGLLCPCLWPVPGAGWQQCPSFNTNPGTRSWRVAKGTDKRGIISNPLQRCAPKMTKTCCQLIRAGLICKFPSWRNLAELKSWTTARSSEPSVHSATPPDKPKDEFAEGWQRWFQCCWSPAWSILAVFTSVYCFVFQRGTGTLNKSSLPALSVSTSFSLNSLKHLSWFNRHLRETGATTAVMKAPGWLQSTSEQMSWVSSSGCIHNKDRSFHVAAQPLCVLVKSYWSRGKWPGLDLLPVKGSCFPTLYQPHISFWLLGGTQWHLRQRI